MSIRAIAISQTDGIEAQRGKLQNPGFGRDREVIDLGRGKS